MADKLRPLEAMPAKPNRFRALRAGDAEHLVAFEQASRTYHATAERTLATLTEASP